MRYPHDSNKPAASPNAKIAVALVLLMPFFLAACSSGDGDTSSTTTTTGTAPSAPTIGVATPGNTNANIAFTAPSSIGSSAITAYTATCAAGAASLTGTASASPITVSNLVNGTAYSCTVTATNSAGVSAASAAVSVTPVASTNAVPGAPTIGAATAGNASANIAFTAPSSTGSAAITAYTATCTTGTISQTGTASASPITVSNLTNGTAYSCTVTATNSVGISAASAAVSVTPVATVTGTNSTLGVLCTYSYNALNTSASVNKTSTAAWTCGTTRTLVANGLPDHAVGTFPNANNPNTISAQTVSASYKLSPTFTGTALTLGGPRGATGYVLNGIKIDAGTAGSCPASATASNNCSAVDNSSPWSIEALGQSFFNFGTDTNNAHVQPTGEYHYHGMPEGFITLRGGGPTRMTLIGWAADGFPIYARYGYSVATNASSALKVVTGSYKLKTTIATNRPSSTVFTLGGFAQDWEYIAGSGDLDECNGRVGVTPEFPNGIYHYYATDSYPYFQRCIKGSQ
jgi:YHYH protein/Fibronectin type III domain